MAAELATESGQRYGRDAVDVDLDLQAAWERVHGPPTTGQGDAAYPAPKEPPADGAGGAAPTRVVTGNEVPCPGKRAARKNTKTGRDEAARRRRAATEGAEPGEAPEA